MSRPKYICAENWYCSKHSYVSVLTIVLNAQGPVLENPSTLAETRVRQCVLLHEHRTNEITAAHSGLCMSVTGTLAGHINKVLVLVDYCRAYESDLKTLVFNESRAESGMG